ncbi:MAG TPA: P-loop NTPase [Rectinemataceae bacterium]|nr:P-loop NTPase [Rectinemataceae bacterium]
MTGKVLLDKLGLVGTLEFAFRFPYAYVRCVSPAFIGKDDDEREALAAAGIQENIADIRKTAAACLLTLEFLSPEEASGSPMGNRGDHWLRAFLKIPAARHGQPKEMPKIAHFYGYKGGQGRSSVLAALAQHLAREGLRVLLVDADIEAPSLDIIFGVRPAGEGATLLGIAQKGSMVKAVPVISEKGGGEVRLIACRNRDVGFDIDFAAFTLQTSLLPGILEKPIERIKEWAERESFDLILIDHRSGMAMTTLTWLEVAPGPVVVFARLDDQWSGAKEVFRGIFSTNADNPGIIVSFKPDTETEESYRRRNVRQVDELLDLLIEARTTTQEGDADDLSTLDPSDIEDHWIIWPYDQAFRTNTLPDINDLGVNTRGVLVEIQRLIDVYPQRDSVKLSPIGSLDLGDLIQTVALQELRQTGNEVRYVFGRKGTGKTRLAKQLCSEGLGEALLVDSSSEQAVGLSTASIEFQNARDQYGEEPETLWWALLVSGLRNKQTPREDMRRSLVEIAQSGMSAPAMRQEALDCLSGGGPRAFLLDGIETAFTYENIYRYVEALFHFMLTIQSEERLGNSLKIILFLRADLAYRSGVQNIEQQIEGKKIVLNWDYQSILNFTLSRIPEYDFFRANFPEPIKDIKDSIDEIRQRALSPEKCERILLQILPNNLSRSNILTTTFLRLHFADSSSQGASYYPRVFDSFLGRLNETAEKLRTSAMINGRLDQQLLFRAHEAASVDYLDQIRQELIHLLDFGEFTQGDRVEKLNQWISAFSGQKTPFVMAEMEQFLIRTVGLSAAVVRRSLEQMREFGIFERTEDPNVWRTGRLFKASLKMKFLRA